jgi:hypothetical protein
MTNRQQQFGGLPDPRHEAARGDHKGKRHTIGDKMTHPSVTENSDRWWSRLFRRFRR